LHAFENQDYQYEELVETRVTHRDAGRNPLFDTMFALRNQEDEEVNIPGLTLKPIPHDHGTSKFDLGLTVIEEGEQLSFEWEYCTALFKKDTIGRWNNYFKTAVSNVLANPTSAIAGIGIIPEAEKQQLLSEFNHTESPYPYEKTLHQLFEEQVRRTPDRTALIGPSYGNNRSYRTHRTYLTYNELDRQANRLARQLNEKGVRPDTKPDTIIAIKMKSSLEMIITIFGILKAGGAYLPIDPGYPQERIDYILRDSGAEWLIDDREQELKQDGKEHHPQPTPADSLAYVIYTSGTTGKPKGVLVEHRSVVANVFAFYNEFNIKPSDTFIQLNSYAFDAFVEEVFPILLRGGKIAIPPAARRLDIHFLSEFIAKHDVNIVDTTPLLLKEFNGLNAFDGVDTWISGGDVLKREYVSQFPGNVKIYNTYGPTEATVCATYYHYRCPEQAEKTEDIPIGKPIANYHIHILDTSGALQPIGVPGELCIGGHGIARGYLNRPELTHSKFQITNTPTIHRFYRTGDLGRWLPDGNIQFLGRVDQQVKIRGLRIEPAEIEAQLARHDQIKEAVVIDHQGTQGDKYLCAYCIPRNPGDSLPPSSQLRHYLSLSLPNYMIPSFFVQIHRLPLNANGKVNRSALPAPSASQLLQLSHLAGTDHTNAPRTALERTVARVWADVLGWQFEQIDIHHNFFEMGGDSIKVIRTASRLKKQSLSIDAAQLFSYQTIAQIAAHLEHSSTGTTHARPPKTGSGSLSDQITEEDETIRRRETAKMHDSSACFTQNTVSREYPVSPIQRSRLILENEESLARHLLFTRHDFSLPPDRIEDIITTLIEENSLLRTVIIEKDGEFWFREFDTVTGIELPYMDISHYSPSAGRDILRRILQDMHQPMPLFGHALFRLFLLKSGEQRYSVLFVINHLIFDGGSQRLLKVKLDEISRRHINPGNPQTSYFDYCRFIRQQDYRETGLGPYMEPYIDTNAYTRAVEEVSAGFENGNIKTFAFEIDMSLLDYSRKELYNEFMLLTYAGVLGELFGISPVPVRFVSQGRFYKDAQFGDVLGDFHDFIPMLFRAARENSQSQWHTVQHILDYRNMVKETNLNFTATILNREPHPQQWLKWLSPFTFNSLVGLYGEVAGPDRFDHEPREDYRHHPAQMGLVLVKSPDSNRLWLEVTHNSRFKDNEIKEQFMKQFNRLKETSFK
jgi:amino acid adenylation domain-containing protein